MRSAPQTLHFPGASGPEGDATIQRQPLPCFSHSVGGGGGSSGTVAAALPAALDFAPAFLRIAISTPFQVQKIYWGIMPPTDCIQITKRHNPIHT